MISHPLAIHGRIGCALMHANSIYQPFCPSLRGESFSRLPRRNHARFIRSFNQLKSKFGTKEMHICQI